MFTFTYNIWWTLFGLFLVFVAGMVFSVHLFGYDGDEPVFLQKVFLWLSVVCGTFGSALVLLHL